MLRKLRSGMKAKFTNLNALIDNLRAKGVAAYKGSDFNDGVIELALHPEEPIKPEKERKKSVEEQIEGVKRGADGLTAQQQEDLYGAVIDASQGS